MFDIEVEEKPLAKKKLEKRKVQNPFATADDDSDVLLKVGNHTLHLHSWLLSYYSPIFKSMLNGNFKEGITKEIELKEKEPESVIEMFTYFYSTHFPIITDKTNFKKLLSLCREYQLTWLTKRFEDYLLESKRSIFYGEEEMIKSINMAEEFDMPRLKTKLMQHDFTSTFGELRMYEGFEQLNRKTKYEILKKRLCYLVFNNNTEGESGNKLSTKEKSPIKKGWMGYTNSKNDMYSEVTYGGTTYQCDWKKQEEYIAITSFLEDLIEDE